MEQMGEHIKQDPTTDIISYLRELIAVPTVSPPGETSKMAAYLSTAFAAMGYATETVSAVPGLDNVVARMGSGSPSLVFNVHVDTVDAGDLSRWSHPPLEATRVGVQIFGLGRGQLQRQRRRSTLVGKQDCATRRPRTRGSALYLRDG